MVRENLVHELSSGNVTAIGLWDDQRLCGVAVWKVFDAARLCKGILVAVANGHRRKGYGRRLKEEMMKSARVAGAVAISSTVDRRNDGMIAINRSVGAVFEALPDDPDNLRCTVALR